ncbi:hypothetical protein ACTU6U_11860 [Microbacterium sp. A196]
MKAWKKLREQLITAASDRGVAVIEGSRPLARTAETSASGALIWRPVA